MRHSITSKERRREGFLTKNEANSQVLVLSFWLSLRQFAICGKSWRQRLSVESRQQNVTTEFRSCHGSISLEFRESQSTQHRYFLLLSRGAEDQIINFWEVSTQWDHLLFVFYLLEDWNHDYRSMPILLWSFSSWKINTRCVGGKYTAFFFLDIKNISYDGCTLRQKRKDLQVFVTSSVACKTFASILGFWT